MASFPGDPSVIHNVRQRSDGSLTIGEDRDADERKTVGENLMRSTAYGYF